MEKYDLNNKSININFHNDYYENIRTLLNEADDHIYTEADHEIASITPLTLYDMEENESDDKKFIMIYLCKSGTGKLFTITNIYQTSDENEIKFIEENIPFYNNKKTFGTEFSRQLVDNILIDTLPSYLSSFNLKTEDGCINNNTERFYIDAYTYIEDNKTEVKFYMDNNIALSVLFIESYIFDGIKNNHDIALASSMCSKSSPTSVFVVDKIDGITDLASPDMKSNIAILFKMIYYLQSDAKDTCYLLANFDTGVKINKKMCTTDMDTLMKNYMKDANQFISEYFFTNTINDNSYTIYCSKNKNKLYRFFLLDNATMKILENLVNEI